MIERLVDLVRRHPRLFVLTGAGCSTASGIPDYRDADGQWKHRRPVQYADFLRSDAVRRRYWARSLAGWPRVANAQPGPAHLALARLEATGHVTKLVTQNVDGLHQRAGSRQVIDLHGRLHDVVCMECGQRIARSDLQELLAAWNPDHAGRPAPSAPDGDAHIEDAEGFRVPDCPQCGGVLKPDVVFFGENVPARRVEAAYTALARSDAVLVAGSSLMVYSGLRFCLAAREQGKPVLAVNDGRTRADELLALKVRGDCGVALAALVDVLSENSPAPAPVL